MDRNDSEIELGAAEKRQWDRIFLVPNTNEIYDAHPLDADSIFRELVNLIIRNEIDDRGVEFLMVLARTFLHRNPTYKLTSERAPEGCTFRFAAKMLAAPLMKDMVDAIDQEVAGGCKLESAVQTAMETYKLSRREVFRCIKEIRNHRLKALSSSNKYGFPISAWDWPAGYDIDTRGRLVPASI